MNQIDVTISGFPNSGKTFIGLLLYEALLNKSNPVEVEFGNENESFFALNKKLKDKHLIFQALHDKDTKVVITFENKAIRHQDYTR